ncbi:MAG: SIS domain-containing protein [bacterium]
MSQAVARRYTVGQEHVRALSQALDRFGPAVEVAERWGRTLAEVLPTGVRLLAAGNGGSAAQAQHLTSEIVGRYCLDRPAMSAVSLHSEPSALTAILNDFGPQEVFARQVAAHGRPGDVCVLMSTSGTSANVLAAAVRARALGLHTWAMTGPGPNPLVDACDEALCVEAAETAVVQELHLVGLHLICAAMDDVLLDPAGEAA